MVGLISLSQVGLNPATVVHWLLSSQMTLIGVVFGLFLQPSLPQTCD